MGQDTKAVREEVVARLMAGDSPAELAEAYGLPAATVRSWRARHVATQRATLATRATHVALDADQEAAIGMRFVAAVDAGLTALTRLALLFQDEEWIRTYSPQQAAAAYATIADKVFTALAVFNREPEREVTDGATHADGDGE